MKYGLFVGTTKAANYIGMQMMYVCVGVCIGCSPMVLVML